MASNLEVTLASGDSIAVNTFSVEEQISNLFQVTLQVRSKNPDIDFDAVVGKEASFTMHAGSAARTWAGICNHFQQLQAEEAGMSSYHVSLVPSLWLTTQRRNHRMFQHLSEIEIV